MFVRAVAMLLLCRVACDQPLIELEIVVDHTDLSLEVDPLEEPRFAAARFCHQYDLRLSTEGLSCMSLLSEEIVSRGGRFVPWQTRAPILALNRQDRQQDSRTIQQFCDSQALPGVACGALKSKLNDLVPDNAGGPGIPLYVPLRTTGPGLHEDGCEQGGRSLSLWIDGAWQRVQNITGMASGLLYIPSHTLVIELTPFSRQLCFCAHFTDPVRFPRAPGFTDARWVAQRLCVSHHSQPHRCDAWGLAREIWASVQAARGDKQALKAVSSARGEGYAGQTGSWGPGWEVEPARIRLRLDLDLEWDPGVPKLFLAFQGDSLNRAAAAFCARYRCPDRVTSLHQITTALRQTHGTDSKGDDYKHLADGMRRIASGRGLSMGKMQPSP